MAQHLLLMFLTSLSLTSLADASVNSLELRASRRLQVQPVQLPAQAAKEDPIKLTCTTFKQGEIPQPAAAADLPPLEIRQITCQANIPGDVQAPEGICIRLKCINIAPPMPCNAVKDQKDCSWNISPQCATPYPVWPGSLWGFGIITTVQEPISFDFDSYAQPVNWKCPL